MINLGMFRDLSFESSVQVEQNSIDNNYVTLSVGSEIITNYYVDTTTSNSDDNHNSRCNYTPTYHKVDNKEIDNIEEIVNTNIENSKESINLRERVDMLIL